MSHKLSEKELDFLYWCLVDYCENNIPQELKECANINRIFKKVVKLNDLLIKGENHGL